MNPPQSYLQELFEVRLAVLARSPLRRSQPVLAGPSLQQPDPACNCRPPLQKYDADGNNLLTFGEFAQMWHAVGEEFAGEDELGLVRAGASCSLQLSAHARRTREEWAPP